MSAFNFQAMDDGGKTHKGVIEADNARQARQLLRERHLLPIDVALIEDRATRVKNKNITLIFRRKKLSAAQLSLITRQMATLLSANIPLDDMLLGVTEQNEAPHVKSLLSGVRAKVMEGYSLSAALDAFPTAFPKLFRTTVAAGEQSGKLDQILERLADYTEQQHDMKQTVRQALIYPTLMTIVSVFVVIFMLIYVVPKIVTVFSQTQQVLPLVTIVLISISTFVKKYGLYLIALLIAAGCLCRRLLKKEAVRCRFDGFLLKLPVIGKALKTVNTARFGRTFGILTAAGVPVLEGMQAAMQLAGPLPMRRSLEQAIECVREGGNISTALQKTHYFAPMFTHLVASGEASGTLSLMLEKAAANQERDVRALIQAALTLFEPAMILIMGAIVLFIVLAIMLPIFSLDQLPGV